MNIFVIFTGGTISSSENDGYIGPNEENNYRLINEYRKRNPEKCDGISFSTAKPYYILSENLTGKHINLLADCIDEAVSSDTCDGIIVTHGTDTLQYTAAGLSYIYSDINIPIVLVSSNYILGDSRANGYDNFSAAMDFIMSCHKTAKKNHRGIYVAYKNENEAAVIHHGARLLPHMSYSDKIYSVDNLTAYSDSKEPCKIDKTDMGFIFGDKPRFSEHSPITFIRPYPGETYSLAPEYVHAILLDTYHSGTLCTDSNELRNMLFDAKSRNIPVFLTGAENRMGYESTKVYDELKINVLPKASPIAMYMKLWLLASTGCDNISKYMNTPICFDII
ncbi:MAG: asparaginase domain-containing protein [Lachnospiraceae bacterium]|nr:asparaginase domain-containing protein [Lachnospiraceae bacterium]